jgi:uncharacterized membrane protein required for colicin V production
MTEFQKFSVSMLAALILTMGLAMFSPTAGFIFGILCGTLAGATYALEMTGA